MKIMKFFISLILVSVLLVTGCTPGVTPSQLTIPSVSGEELSNPKLVIAGSYETEESSISLNASSYLLPLDVKEIVNFGELESALHLN